MIRLARVLMFAAAIGGVTYLAWPLINQIFRASDAQVRSAASTAVAYRHHALVQRKVGFYAVFLPPDYDAPEARDRHYPLIVILHGHGSNEINHGRLSERLGIDEAIYVAPRAPHPMHQAFLEMNQPGFSAWPNYPTTWGQWNSESFPREELANIDVTQLYTDWIAQTIVDVRKRYRSDGRKVVVLGHSQGATFAFSLAIRHPGLLSGFFAHAGHYGLEKLDERSASILESNRIVPFITHYEGDPVVSISESRKLLDFLRLHEITHHEALLESGDHSIGPAVIRAAQSFIREQHPGID